MKTRRRSTMVVAGGTALFAAAVLTGCGSDPEPDYQGVCVDQSTQKRVDDDECDDDNSHGSSRIGGPYVYRMWPSGTRFPAVGGKVSDYPGSVTTLPEGHSATLGGADRSGGTVSTGSAKKAAERGGFGKTSRSHSGSVGG